jgi:hypothetical protein
MESITFEDVWFTTSTTPSQKQLSICVYNTGKIDLNITSVFINGNLAAAKDVSGALLTSQTMIKVGEHLQIIVPYDWQAAESYKIKIQTVRGSGFEGVYTAQ